MQKIPHVINLSELIHSHYKNNLTEPICQLIIKQLITILLNCKYKSILHNNVKYENILINPDSFEITLIDFSASQVWIDNYKYIHYTGTTLCCCPEFFLSGKYTADGITVWSIGMLCYYMLYGNYPYLSIVDIKKKYLIIPECPFVSQLCKSFLYNCLAKSETLRPVLVQLKNHNWLQ